MKWKTAITKIENNKEIVRGKSLEKLSKEKTFTEMIFLVVRGKLPNTKEAKMFDTILSASIDHGVGAPSATVARTVVSTGNSFHTALAAGVQTLGDLHGGAIEGAGTFFAQYAAEKDLESLVKKMKEEKKRIPGYGHKVLTHDHRADVVFGVAKKTGFYGKYSKFAAAVEKALSKVSSKTLPLNIDGVTAAVLLDMGFDPRMMKGVFVIARVPGLVAHVWEEMTSGEGIRRVDESDIEYVG